MVTTKSPRGQIKIEKHKNNSQNVKKIATPDHSGVHACSVKKNRSS